MIDKGKNPVAQLLSGGINSNFQDNQPGAQYGFRSQGQIISGPGAYNDQDDNADDNELFMGGIPNNMAE